MLKNQAIDQSGLTKKAVEYYIQEGLVCPKLLENGYRDFTEADVERLKTISLYRKLGLDLAEIKQILTDASALKTILHKHTLEQQKANLKLEILQQLCQGTSLFALQQKVEQIDGSAVIRKRLMELFPGAYGKLIVLSFAPYLDVRIESQEQLEAFHEMVCFFDDVPELQLPAELQQYLDDSLTQITETDMKAALENKTRAVENIEEFLSENRQMIEDYLAFKQSEEYHNSPMFQLMTCMKQLCATNGYFDRFLPALRRLSPLYDQYYRQMLKADQRFLEQYPDAAK